MQLDEGRDVGDWLVDHEARLERLERRGGVSVGRYAIREDADGNLIALNTLSGRFTLLVEVAGGVAPPAGPGDGFDSDADPDFGGPGDPTP